MNSFIIFPNQLYELSSTFWQQYDIIYIVEEPIYFYDEKYKPFKPSKIKLAFLRACMKTYFDTLLSSFKNKNIQYIEYKPLCKTGYSSIFSKSTQVSFFDPHDHDLMKKLKSYNKPLNVLESPNFLIGMPDLKGYHSGTCSFTGFFSFAKRTLDIMSDMENQDKANRKALPKTTNIPPPYKPKLTHYHTDAINYVNKIFKDHMGTCENVSMYPTTSPEAYASFKQFLKTRLVNFGDYQDAIKQDEALLFHSGISSSLNVGLLDPKKIIKMTLAYYQKNKAHIPQNNVEGFLRQIVGWREYMRYLYMFRHEVMIKSNLAKNNKRLSIKWFKGQTDIQPFDDEFAKCIDTGYAHHIVRLMVFMNLMILHEITPEDIYKWFMEVVCIDAYSWVMVPNIYGMGHFYKGATTRPYLSSSNYIIKMSDYKADGKWDKTWDDQYRSFVSKKPKEYVAFYKR